MEENAQMLDCRLNSNWCGRGCWWIARLEDYMAMRVFELKERLKKDAANGHGLGLSIPTRPDNTTRNPHEIKRVEPARLKNGSFAGQPVKTRLINGSFAGQPANTK